MRLIDADLLIEWIDAGHLRNPNELCFSEADVVEMIDHMPTIEERKRGKWLFPYGDKKYKRCSVCESDYYSIPYNSNFCPNCGADMRGDENG